MSEHDLVKFFRDESGASSDTWWMQYASITHHSETR